MKPSLMSVCIPYWERQVALDRMFPNYMKLYSECRDIRLEFSVCDDGSPTQPARVPSHCILTRLPKKDHPLNPCVPINHAVASSSGEIIVLTNAEVEHREPVLDEMRSLLGPPGEQRYIIASCKEVESGGWLAGPEVDYRKQGRSPVPPGGHFHFLAMFWRQLWNRAGGFDEDYRNGQACDDNDWLWRLWSVGARFVTTQGVVWHHRGTRLKWKLPHNNKLLRQKWPQIERLARIRDDANYHKDRRDRLLRERERASGRGTGIPASGLVSATRDTQHEGAGRGVCGSDAGAAVGQNIVRGHDGGLVGGEVSFSSNQNSARVSSDVPVAAATEEQSSVPGVCDAGVDASGDGSAGRREGLVHPEWALILGGGELVWDEVLAWEELYGRQWDGVVVAANDVGSHWPRALDHWVTLHPDKMVQWRKQRAAYRFSEDYETWGRQRHHVDHTVRPWAGGARGMLAIQVAHILGCRRAILCGIPMTPSPHFTESIIHASGRPWKSVAGHWRAWNAHLDKMAGWVRSMSGRTQEILGTPTLAWLEAEES